MTYVLALEEQLIEASAFRTRLEIIARSRYAYDERHSKSSTCLYIDRPGAAVIITVCKIAIVLRTLISASQFAWVLAILYEGIIEALLSRILILCLIRKRLA